MGFSRAFRIPARLSKARSASRFSTLSRFWWALASCRRAGPSGLLTRPAAVRNCRLSSGSSSAIIPRSSTMASSSAVASSIWCFTSTAAFYLADPGGWEPPTWDGSEKHRLFNRTTHIRHGVLPPLEYSLDIVEPRFETEETSSSQATLSNKRASGAPSSWPAALGDDGKSFTTNLPLSGTKSINGG